MTRTLLLDDKDYNDLLFELFDLSIDCAAIADAAERGEIKTDPELWGLRAVKLKELREAVRGSAITHCQDCIYRKGSCCDYSAVFVRSDGFCSWGKMNDENTQN